MIIFTPTCRTTENHVHVHISTSHAKLGRGGGGGVLEDFLSNLVWRYYSVQALFR